MTKGMMDKFVVAMGLDIRGRRGVTELRMRERRAIYAFCFTAIKRLAGAGHVIAPNTIRIPVNEGLVLNCTWDKTLRMGGTLLWLPVCERSRKVVCPLYH